MGKGKFIVIEGGEGSGKSSAVAWLKSKFPENSLVFTREPGGTEAAEEIRAVLIKKRSEHLDVLTQIALFAAARREHMRTKVIPALKVGKHVICDRFSASTYAYQIVAGNGAEHKKFFEIVDTAARDGIEPDLTVFLDVDPTIGLARKSSSGDELNVFDERELSFHEAVRRGMKEYLTTRPHTVVDASQSQQQVREAVYDAVKKFLK